MRVLLDTNILISSLLSTGGPPAQLLDLWLEGRFDLVTSGIQLEELRGVLARPRLSRRITPGKAASLLEHIEHEAICVHDLPSVNLSPDADDNRILATAVAGEADLIVSGDYAGMLDLGEVCGIPIVAAREAVERVE